MTTDVPRADDLRMDVGALLGAVLARWLRIVTVTLVLMAAAYAVLMFTPKMYESSASILVEGRDNAFTVPATATGAGSGGAAVTIDALVSSQVELIKSRDALLAVVDQLNLRSVPEFNGTGPNPLNLVFQLVGRKPEAKSVDETVLANLNDRLTVIRERDSAIISIFVRSQSPQLAADIANAIAAEHLKRRTQQSLTDTAEASAWLEQEIVKLRQRVAKAETDVAKFRADNDLFEGANNTSLVDQQLSALATQITAAQERRNAARSRAALIRKMVDAGQPIDGLADVQNSAVIQRLSQSKADLQGQLAERSSTLLPNHPTMRALNAQVREIDRQIAAEGRRVASALEAEAQIESDLEASLQDELKKLKGSAATAATSGVTLDQLEREAKAQRDLLESYLLRYRDAVSRSDSSSTLPDVRIVTGAAPSSTPASPKTGFILAAVGIGAVALQVGAIMFGELLSGRAVVEAGRPVAWQRPPASWRGTYEPDEPQLPFEAAGEDAVPQARTPRRGWFGRRRGGPRRTSGPGVGIVQADAAADKSPGQGDVPAATAAAPSAIEAAATAPFAPMPEVVETEAEPALPEPLPERARRWFGRRQRPRPEPAADATAEAEPAALAPIVEDASVPVAEPAALEPEIFVAEEMPATDAAPLDEALEPELDEPVPAEPARRVGWLARIWGRGRTHGPAAPPEAEADVDAVVDAAIAVSEDATPAGEATTEPELADPAPEPAPPVPPEAAPPAPARSETRESHYPSALATLGADIALGRVRVVMIAGLTSADDCLPVTEALAAQALRAGLSVVRVDAGSAEVSSEPGVTDLAADRASFGDIVHKGTREGLSEVPWGHQVALDRRSPKPGTLVEALTDIYEVVLVMTGRVGMSSSLPMFSGIAGRLVLASVGRADPDHIDAALAETSALGFRTAQVIVAPSRQAEVA